MTTFLIIAGGFGGVIILLLLYGSAKKREGRTQERKKALQSEINSVQKAQKIEEDHKHDSRSDIIDGL